MYARGESNIGGNPMYGSPTADISLTSKRGKGVQSFRMIEATSLAKVCTRLYDMVLGCNT